MLDDQKISLDCPCCGEEIRSPLEWFKKDYNTCPSCGGGLVVGQFASAVAGIEEEIDHSIDEMINGEPGRKGGCCGTDEPGHKGGCCGTDEPGSKGCCHGADER